MLLFVKVHDCPDWPTGRYDIGGAACTLFGIDVLNQVRLHYKYQYFRVGKTVVDRPDFARSIIRPYSVVRVYTQPPKGYVP